MVRIVRRTLAAEVAVGEEPILPPEHQRAELALEAVVRELEPSVGEAQEEAVPLAKEVADRLAESRLRGDDSPVLLEPGTQLGDHRYAVLGATAQALFRRLAEQGREALDGEDAAELGQRHEGE